MARRDSYLSKVLELGLTESTAKSVVAYIEEKGLSESFLIRPEDFDLDTGVREELTESNVAYLIFDRDTLVEVKKSALPVQPEANVTPEEEDSTEDENPEEEDAEVPPTKKKKPTFEAVRESLKLTNYELVDLYSDYAVVTSGDATGDYKLYRAPLVDGRLSESTNKWEEIEISYLPDSAPLDEPIESEVAYTGETIVQSFDFKGYELTDVYPGYVLALKEGQKYRFNFVHSDNEVVFSEPILENSEVVDYTGEQVVESYLDRGFTNELTDVFPSYVIAKDKDGVRYRYNFVSSNGDIVFESTPITVQPVLNTVRVIEAEDKVETIAESVTEGKARTLYLSEGLDLKESAVNRKQGIVDVTLIKPGWSLNGRYYSPKVLQQSLKVWDGIKAYGNHPTVTESKELPERSIWDQVGYYTNPRWEDGRVKATLKLVGDDERKSHILDWAEESAKTGLPLMGLSINAVGKTTMGAAEGRKGIIVEDIAAGSSVDVVTTPSAGGSFDKLLASDDGFTNLLLQNLEYDEWREARPDFFKRLQKEMKLARKEELENRAIQEATNLRESLKGKEGELTEAREQVNRTEAKLTEVLEELEKVKLGILVDQKLQESKLPEEWVSSLRPKLLEAGFDGVDALITEEKKKFLGIKAPIKVIGSGHNQDLGNQNRVAESLGVGILPLPFERPEEYQARKEKLLAR